MNGGLLGGIFTALSFSGALVAAIAFFRADRGPEAERGTWARMGKIAFGLHGLSVFGVIGTLFYLIYTHQYQYHYVWNHSSNELPVHYMISCFWEGQEGSFLLWTFWHVILGGLMLFTLGSWRNIVMSVVSSVNLILASMILGVYVPENIAAGLFTLALLIPAGYLAWRAWKGRDSLGSGSILQVAAVVIALLGVYLALSGKAGSFSFREAGTYTSGETVGYLIMFLALIAFLGFLKYHLIVRIRSTEAGRLGATEIFSYFCILGLTFVAMTSGIGVWKVGSSPFLLLRDAFPDAPIFASNPDFVPANGTGLNPLLQNYWMVIHPPTLFLGFASTVAPFAFVIGGLVSGRYREWIRPAAPWTIFSVMILGIGIIMGGYWAYETLNFGGYWNWDPVENSSFVPWIFGIAALHAMVAYRKSRVFLKMTMFMVITVFLFVLYSTFLTRSGVLGETSVHTFTDLGLSGQLLLLFFIYLFGIIALFLSRAKDMPVTRRHMALKSAEFVIFLGVLTLFAAGVVITMFTSIPVINQILGTRFAPPTEGGFFYYRWTVWFAVGLAVLSGIGQYLFWRRQGKKSVRQALTRPYFLAMGLAVAIILAIVFLTRWEFSFDDEFREWKELADTSPSVVSAAIRYIRLGFFTFADEIMLLASLFMVLANADVLIHLVRKNQRATKVTGGSIAHIGFGLMLLGFLFSSGYDQVISKNVNPNELAALPSDARVDNVLLEKNRPRNIVGYEVTYIGKKEAHPPISDLEVITQDEGMFKVAFRDSTGDQYAYELPRDVFTDADGTLRLDVVEHFLNDKIEFLQPRHINDRTLYGVRFVPRKLNSQGEPYLQKDRAFVLYPEAEVNPTMGLVAHPSRKILPGSDIYVHVSTIPKEEEAPKFEFYNFELSIGDTIQTARAAIHFAGIVPEPHQDTPYDLIARADMVVLTDRGNRIVAQPLYRIDSTNRVSIKDFFIEEIHTSIAFVGIDTETGKAFFQVQEQTNPSEDIIVIQALRKPFINILWLGTFVLVIGFGIAMYRRIRENIRGKSAGKDDTAEESQEDPDAQKTYVSSKGNTWEILDGSAMSREELSAAIEKVEQDGSMEGFEGIFRRVFDGKDSNG